MNTPIIYFDITSLKTTELEIVFLIEQMKNSFINIRYLKLFESNLMFILKRRSH